MLHRYISSKKSNERGFTLIEIAIVLIIIGLILGMVFKGRQLIDSAKVKSLEANYNKILTAVNTFYDRYGFYPGDGCPSGAITVSACTGTKNGKIDTNNEATAFWVLLINTGLLSDADTKTHLGTKWFVYYDNSLTPNGNWLKGDVDKRYICDIDRKIDDGKNDSGSIQAIGTSNSYGTTTDCWSLTGTTGVDSDGHGQGEFYLFP